MCCNLYYPSFAKHELNFREYPNVKEILSKTLTGIYLLKSPWVEIISLSKSGLGYDKAGYEIFKSYLDDFYVKEHFFYKLEWRSELSGRILFEVFNI